VGWNVFELERLAVFRDEPKELGAIARDDDRWPVLVNHQLVLKGPDFGPDVLGDHDERTEKNRDYGKSQEDNYREGPLKKANPRLHDSTLFAHYALLAV
jgi:hypothetical protein